MIGKLLTVILTLVFIFIVSFIVSSVVALVSSYLENRAGRDTPLWERYIDYLEIKGEELADRRNRRGKE